MTKTVKVTHETQILKLATLSRLLLLALTILWRALLSPYDTSASLNPDCLADPLPPQHSRNNPIGSAIENGVVWDSVYFVRIAQCGYEYEQSFAFLPLLPLCIRLLSHSGKTTPSLSFRFVWFHTVIKFQTWECNVLVPSTKKILYVTLNCDPGNGTDITLVGSEMGTSPLTLLGS